MSALSLQGLHKQFGSTAVLAGVSLDIQAGEFLILVGPSGCGKSTLLSLLAGLEAPSSGQIFMNGRDITALPSRERDIAMVFQSYALYPNMTVAGNIAFGLEMRKVPKAEREATVQRVARTLQLEDLLARKPAQLSGGQRQRVAMGRALARAPKLFLFDEPLSNLDAKLRVDMRAEIKLLHQRTGTTTVYVTHDQVEAMTLGTRIAVMNGGRIEQLGSPQAIYGRPATAFVAQFIGSPSMNMLPCTVGPGHSVLAAGHALPVSAEQQAALQVPMNNLLYGLRPEALRLLPAGSAEFGVDAQVQMLEPTGPETFVKLTSVVGTLTMRVGGASSLELGQAVRLAWSPQEVHLFDARSGQRIG